MALDESSLVELKKLVTLGQNSYRLFADAGESLIVLESLFQSVREKETELATLDESIGKLNNSILSAKGKLKEAQDDAKGILTAAREEYDTILSKAKVEADKIKALAKEKSDKEYAKATLDKIKVDESIVDSKEILATLSVDIEAKTQELKTIEEKLTTVKEQIARLAGA
jgi:cell division septum initiation protein DivIVA